MTRNDSPFSEKGEQMLELLTDFAEDGGPLIEWDELSKTRWCPHHPQTDHTCRLCADQYLSIAGGGQSQIGTTCRN